MNQNDLPVLWYFADPMCSWCWGFTPIIEDILKSYEGKLNCALVLGGLRTGAANTMSAEQRDEILHHWQEVHKMTGQTFTFDGAMPEGFIYDTEPACRAVAAISGINAGLIFPLFKSIQAAFYKEGLNVTQTEVLADLAHQLGVDQAVFLSEFESAQADKKVKAHFAQTRQFGVRGFPTLVLQSGSRYQLLNNGYRTLAELKPEIDAWLLNRDKLEQQEST